MDAERDPDAGVPHVSRDEAMAALRARPERTTFYPWHGGRAYFARYVFECAFRLLVIVYESPSSRARIHAPWHASDSPRFAVRRSGALCAASFANARCSD